MGAPETKPPIIGVKSPEYVSKFITIGGPSPAGTGDFTVPYRQEPVAIQSLRTNLSCPSVGALLVLGERFLLRNLFLVPGLGGRIGIKLFSLAMAS